eukprot:scaffold32964_cov64-Phaeocystis_antarctica.AAC.2
METSQKVQKANTQMPLPRSRTRWCWSALPCPQWRVPRPAGRESKISLQDAMEEMLRKFRNASFRNHPLTPCRAELN